MPLNSPVPVPELTDEQIRKANLSLKVAAEIIAEALLDNWLRERRMAKGLHSRRNSSPEEPDARRRSR
jgi:hypothetical protein